MADLPIKATLIHKPNRTPGPGLHVPSLYSIEKPEIVVGRAEEKVDMYINSEEKQRFISREHAKILFDFTENKWKIVDNDSINGIYVNNIKVKDKILNDGDTIVFGGTGAAPIGSQRKQAETDFMFTFKCQVNERKRPIDDVSHVERPEPKRARTEPHTNGDTSANDTTIPAVSPAASPVVRATPGRNICLCGKKQDGPIMILCDDCQGWFHGECVGVSAAMAEKLEAWVCPKCKEGKKAATAEKGKAVDKKPKTSDEDPWVLDEGDLIGCHPDPESGDKFWIAEVIKPRKTHQQMRSKKVYIRWFEKDPKKAKHYVKGADDVVKTACIFAAKFGDDVFRKVGKNSWKLEKDLSQWL